MEPKASMLWSILLICFGVFVITNGVSVESGAICKAFNKSSGWKEFCGYDSTASFIIDREFGNLYRVMKRQEQKMKTGMCADIIKLMECSLWFPRCVPEVRGPFLPCRRVCHHVIHKCAEEVRNVSQMLYWNLKLNCDKLPEKNEPGSRDFRRRCFAPQNFKTDVKTGYSEPRKCFPLHMPVCKHLGYNYTVIPKKVQMDIWTPSLIDILNESNTTLCNDLRKQLFCGEFVPFCDPNKEIMYPCRQTCERYYRSKCETKWMSFGNCKSLPDGSSTDGYCFIRDWHFAKSWPGAYEVDARRSGCNRHPQTVAIVVLVGLLIISMKMISIE